MWKIPKSLIILLLCLNITATQHEQFTIFTKIYIIPSKEILIKRWSKIYDLDYSLVMAVVDLESNFDHKAKNPKSTSRGLFQFLKETTRFVGKMNGYNNLNHYEVPIEIQIELGCRYIRWLLDKYEGNEQLAMREYSGGTKGYWKALEKRRIKYDLRSIKEES